MIKVIIAEDHHLVRAGICALLDQHDDIEVIGEAENGAQAVDLAQQLQPHVVVMDIRMPRLNGHAATAAIRATLPTCAVVVLSMYSDPLIVHQALAEGARGYLLKSSLEDELPQAIRAASRGETFLSPALADVLNEDAARPRSEPPAADPLERLTPREREVLRLVAQGHTNREAAQALGIGERTVETHRANLMNKLNVRDVAGLVRLAVKHGLITLDE